MDESAGTAPGWGIIRLHRRRGFYRDSLRSYRVRIDGNFVAKIAAGETKDFPVPSGEHRVRLIIDWFFTSRQVVLPVREGELAELSCRPGGPAIAILFALLVPHRYIRLDAARETSVDQPG